MILAVIEEGINEFGEKNYRKVCQRLNELSLLSPYVKTVLKVEYGFNLAENIIDE